MFGEPDRFRGCRVAEDAERKVGPGMKVGMGDSAGGAASSAGESRAAVIGLWTDGGPDAGVSALMGGAGRISGGEGDASLAWDN